MCHRFVKLLHYIDERSAADEEVVETVAVPVVAPFVVTGAACAPPKINITHNNLYRQGSRSYASFHLQMMLDEKDWYL